MADLKTKIENVLNETRILVLGIQILIGFGFRGFFEPGFDKMAPYARHVQLAALGLMLIGLGIMLVPVSYHRLVLRGRNTAELHRLSTATVTTGLLPFTLAMGLSCFLGAHWVWGTVGASVFGGVVCLLTFVFWYGLEFVAASRRRKSTRLYVLFDPLREAGMNQEQETDLSTRIKQAFTECRVVLPGAQALLGFQLIIMWMTSFYSMPRSWKLLHLASLTSVAVCTILLIAPAAYHRIVEQGEDSEMLHQITARALLASMVFLALGICGDFYVACRLTGVNMPLSLTISLLLLAFFYVAWFGFTLARKRQEQHRRLAPATAGERKIA